MNLRKIVRNIVKWILTFILWLTVFGFFIWLGYKIRPYIEKGKIRDDIVKTNNRFEEI